MSQDVGINQKKFLPVCVVWDYFHNRKGVLIEQFNALHNNNIVIPEGRRPEMVHSEKLLSVGHKSSSDLAVLVGHCCLLELYFDVLRRPASGSSPIWDSHIPASTDRSPAAQSV